MHKETGAEARPYSSIEILDVPLQTQGKANNTPTAPHPPSDEELARAVEFLMAAERDRSK